MKTFIFAFLAFACLFSAAQAAKCLVYGDIAHANGGDTAFWNAFYTIRSQQNLHTCRHALGQPEDHVPAIEYCKYSAQYKITSKQYSILCNSFCFHCLDNMWARLHFFCTEEDHAKKLTDGFRNAGLPTPVYIYNYIC